MFELVANSADVFVIGDLAGSIRSFVGPLALLAMGIIALTFLVQRQFMQFLLFFVIGIGVFAIFYAPDMIKNISEGFGNQASKDLKDTKWK